MAFAGCSFEPIHAGATPEINPVATDTANANPSTGNDGLASTGITVRSDK